jgi:hypothetical protein
MKKVKKIILMIIVVLLSACGGGGGGDSSSSSNSTNSGDGSASIPISDEFVDVGSFGSDSIKNIHRNPMMVKIKMLTIKSIEISRIGDAKAKYELERSSDKESAYGALDFVGSSDADLSNKDNPITLENGRFYHIDTTFDIDGVYPDGVNFEVVLVEDSEEKDDNVTSYTLFNKTIELEEDGEQHFGVDVLIPYFIDIKRHLLVVHLVDEGLEKRVHSDENITSIPQMGATYVDIDYDMNRESVQLLEINSSKYIDIPTKMKFQSQHAQEKSGDASLLFSNLGKYQKGVTISATLEFEGGESVDLYLLNSTTGRIKKEVHYTIPSKYTEEKSEQQDKASNMLPVSQQHPNYHFLVDVHFTQGIEENFGDKRYSIDLTYYLPQEKYQDLLALAPDLSKDINTDGVKGEVKWHVKIDDAELPTIIVPTLGSKFASTTVSLMDTNLTFHTSSIVDQLLTIDAALYIDDQHAYLFGKDKYARVDMSKKKIIGDWKPINERWKGVMDRIDGIDAVYSKDGNIVYFIRGEQSVAYNETLDKVVEVFNITEIPFVKERMPFHKIDAAFYDKEEGVLYMISNKQYVAIKYAEPIESLVIDHRNVYRFQVEGPTSIQEKWGDLSISGAMGLPNQMVLFWDILGRSNMRVNRPDIFQTQKKQSDEGKGDNSIASLEIRGDMGVWSRWYVPGAYAYASSDLSFYLFGHQFSLVSADAKMAASTQAAHPQLRDMFKDNLDELTKITYQYGANLSLYVLGSKIVDKGEIHEGHLSADKIMSKQQEIEKTEIAAYNREWNEKITLFNVHFPVGPVVVQVTGGVDGGVGLNFHLDEEDENGVGVALGSSIYLSSSFADGGHITSDNENDGLSVFFTGGIDEAVVHAGIRGDVRLIMAALNGELDSGFVYNENNLDFNLNADVNFELRLIQAAVSLYAGTRTRIEWCSSWGIPYPCGLGWDDFTYELYHTPWLYNRKWELLNEHLPIASIPLHI